MSSGSDSDSVLSQSDFPETVDRFWGMAVSSDEPQRLSLTSSILYVPVVSSSVFVARNVVTSPVCDEAALCCRLCPFPRWALTHTSAGQ